MNTEYIPTHKHLSATFEVEQIKKWVLEHLNGTVLNACAGPTKLPHDDEILRNDINPDVEADTHVDAAKLCLEYDAEHFDTILFDPPWTMYQANMRYDGHHVTKNETQINPEKLPVHVDRDKEQIGHARLAKDGFNYMLKPGGKVIQLSYNATCMPRRLQYKQIERVMFDPLGEGKTLIGSVDRKTQKKL